MVVTGTPRPLLASLHQFNVFIMLDPNKWVVVYIPGGQRGTNEQVAKDLGALLNDMHVTTFVETNSGSMTNANTAAERKRVLESKFQFLPKRVPHANIILFDDAMKSGETLDYVADLFDSVGTKGRVVALVPTLWGKGDGISEVEYDEITV